MVIIKKYGKICIMSEQTRRLADIYRTMEDISKQHAPNQDVPREIRIFGAEISADIAELTDDELINETIRLDDILKRHGIDEKPLMQIFVGYCILPPRAIADNPIEINKWAFKLLRIAVVGRRFRLEYAERFPDRAVDDYQRSEKYLQGNVVAARVISQYLTDRDKS